VPSTSTRLSLFVPDDDTLFVTEDIAANWESIDDKVVGFLTDVATSRPAASSANEGFLFYATDTQVISFSNGTAWVPTLAVSGSGPITYDANTRVIGWAGDTDDVPEGDNNLYYTDERADGRIAAADLGDLANVDEGSGAESGNVLTYDGLDWVPQQPTLPPVAHSAAVISDNYTFPDGYNGLSVSPTTVDEGVTVTVPDGSSWDISPWEALTTDSVDPVAHSAAVISENYTFPDGYNGLSVSPTTIDGGVTVTVPTGSSWQIAPWEALTTDSVDEGSTNLYYTDARVEAIAAPLYFTENVQVDTVNYTLVLSDVAKVVAMNNSAPATVTVPLNASVAFPVGTVINVYAMTANTVRVEGASGVTVRNEGDIAEQYGEVSLRKRAENEWVLSGNLV
jgi:hypothetical protein